MEKRVNAVSQLFWAGSPNGLLYSYNIYYLSGGAMWNNGGVHDFSNTPTLESDILASSINSFRLEFVYED